MSIYDYESGFGVEDKTSSAMRKAIEEWFSLYYGESGDGDPSQRIAYTVVSKIVKTVFGEYQVAADTEFAKAVAQAVAPYRFHALQMMLVGGECFLKPNPEPDGFSFTLIPRNNILVFRRNALGEPTDVGTVERSTLGKHYYTLLERRTVDNEGYLTIENHLFRSLNAQSLGGEVALSDHPAYAGLASSHRYEAPMGLGLVVMKTPMLNCVDGSADGVAVYAAATGLIRNIDRNEAQLNGEFQRGESRVILSADLLDGEKLISWQQDATMIVAEVNRVAGQEIRALPYLHWWTFLGWFHTVGEGRLSAVVALRRKLRRGQALEPWEKTFYRENREAVDMLPRYSRQEQQERARLEQLLQQTEGPSSDGPLGRE